jgi:MFS family permease
MPEVAPTRTRTFVAAVGGGLPADFWRMWTASAAANLADGIAVVAMPLIAVRLGASPAELAGIVVAQQLPMLAFGLVAGALADRLDRRQTMVAVQLLRVAVVLALVALAATGNLGLPALAVAALGLGVGEAFFDTNAQSLLPMVTGRDRLVAANGRLFVAETVLGTFVGPPVGAFLIAISIPLALGGAALGFALAAVGLALLAGTFRAQPTAERRHLAAEIGDGVRYLAGHPILRTLTLMVALQHLGVSALFTLFPLYALAPGPMGLTEPEFGLMFVTFGLGSLLGSFSSSRIVRRVGRPTVLRLATVVLGLGLLVPALTAAPLLVGLGNLGTGFGLTTFAITNISLRQGLAPAAIMGRVHATYRSFGYLAGVIGAGIAGVIGEVVGLREAFALGALVVFVGLLGGFVVTERRIGEAELEAQAAA